MKIKEATLIVSRLLNENPCRITKEEINALEMVMDCVYDMRDTVEEAAKLIESYWET